MMQALSLQALFTSTKIIPHTKVITTKLSDLQNKLYKTRSPIKLIKDYNSYRMSPTDFHFCAMLSLREYLSLTIHLSQWWQHLPTEWQKSLLQWDGCVNLAHCFCSVCSPEILLSIPWTEGGRERRENLSGVSAMNHINKRRRENWQTANIL